MPRPRYSVGGCVRRGPARHYIKPYDIAVTAALIVIKHYLPAVVVTSDGDDEKWADGRLVCMMACGYGEEFRLD
ncbi:hypothetical protein [Sulfobacillus thermotolerans]|uniref:hypothetical protein n=1 Tax=Sulfobacillus thermotolerans TaxID=338644 RepID=UPI003367F0CC